MAARTARKPTEDDRTGDHHRLCAVLRAERPTEELIRFVAAPDGSMTPDLARRLPGRGVWVTADRHSVEAAIKTRAFGRSLKKAVTAQADLADIVEALLVKRAIEALALANKAGLALSGFDKVNEAIAKGTVAVLAHGQDAAEDGQAKLTRKFEAVQRDKGQTAEIVNDLTIEQLSLAMGRSNVVHAALIHGGVTVKFAGEAGRLRRYRSGIGLPLVIQNTQTAAPIA